MKTLFFSILLILTILIGAAAGVFGAPYYLYNQIVDKNLRSPWYSLDSYSRSWVRPKALKNKDAGKLPNENLWQKFHFEDLYIPLPVRNPFYFVSPKLKFDPNLERTEFGLSILNSKKDLISEVYFLPNRAFPRYLEQQKLFELPLIRKAIESKSNKEIWEDVFSKDISEWNIPFEDMAYNLYLLQFRSKFINKNSLGYGLSTKEDIAIIELDYPNKDFIGELVLTRRGSEIYSFLIITRKGNEEALLIRHKMIHEIDYVKTTPSLADIIHKEFKALEYIDQIDHEGMLYLLSSWSHNQGRKEFLEKAIFFLERGTHNQKQLAPLYKYLLDRYGKIYTKRKVKGIDLDSRTLLKRNIELEKGKELKELPVKEEPAPVKRDYDKEFEDLIQESKKAKKKRSRTLRMD